MKQITAKQKLTIIFLLSVYDNVTSNVYDPFSTYMIRVSSLIHKIYKEGKVSDDGINLLRTARELYLNYGVKYLFYEKTEITRSISIEFLNQFLENDKKIKMDNLHRPYGIVEFKLHRGNEYNDFVTQLNNIIKNG